VLILLTNYKGNVVVVVVIIVAVVVVVVVVVFKPVNIFSDFLHFLKAVYLAELKYS
jgi:hypothetical protein